MADDSGTHVLVTVRYFAAAVEASGCEEEKLELAHGATVAGVKALLVERYGDLMQRVISSGSLLVDGAVRTDDSYQVGERVDVLPPFAGG